LEKRNDWYGTDLHPKHFTMNAMTWTSTEGIYIRNGEEYEK
jgi:hypothetical protein